MGSGSFLGGVRPAGVRADEIHPVFGTRQRGAGLPESAVSVLRHLVHKYGLPAVNQFFANMADYNRLEMFPGVTEKPGNAGYPSPNQTAR